MHHLFPVGSIDSQHDLLGEKKNRPLTFHTVTETARVLTGGRLVMLERFRPSLKTTSTRSATSAESVFGCMSWRAQGVLQEVHVSVCLVH